MTTNPYRAILRDRGLTYRPILGEASAKTVKGQKIGYLTGICYLVPDDKLEDGSVYADGLQSAGAVLGAIVDY